MNHADELVGTVVLVNADLPYDPLGKQDQTGFIMEANLDLDDIYVDFTDSWVGLYAANALRTFLPVDQIEKNLDKVSVLEDFDAVKQLTAIHLFVRYGDKGQQRTAMQIARDNKSIQHLCLDSLQNQIDLKISPGHER